MQLSEAFQSIKNIEAINSQKEQALNILKDVSNNFDFVLLAGGAPRNWQFGKLAKDLDIYVCKLNDFDGDQFRKDEIEKQTLNSIEKIGNIYGELGPNEAKIQTSSNVYSGLVLSHLYNFSVPKANQTKRQDCQLIVIDGDSSEIKNMKSFSRLIFKTYDFGICMTAMDKNGVFYNSPMFESDKKNKTLTVNIRQLKRNNSKGMEKLVSRFEKMEKLFPEHRMRISL
jgi:uncharacterized LabA/DUF88 family protein